jgi:hypothetical protein
LVSLTARCRKGLSRLEEQQQYDQMLNDGRCRMTCGAASPALTGPANLVITRKSPGCRYPRLPSRPVTDLALRSPSVVDGYASNRAPAAAMAGELVAHVLAELPALAALDDRDRLLAAACWASTVWSSSCR